MPLCKYHHYWRLFIILYGNTNMSTYCVSSHLDCIHYVSLYWQKNFYISDKNAKFFSRFTSFLWPSRLFCYKNCLYQNIDDGLLYLQAKIGNIFSTVEKRQAVNESANRDIPGSSLLTSSYTPPVTLEDFKFISVHQFEISNNLYRWLNYFIFILLQSQSEFSFHNNHISERHLEPVFSMSRNGPNNDYGQMTNSMPKDRMVSNSDRLDRILINLMICSSYCNLIFFSRMFAQQID